MTSPYGPSSLRADVPSPSARVDPSDRIRTPNSITKQATLKDGLFRYLAEKEGFEPSIRFRIHTFQACAFDHSATSPNLQSRAA